MDNLTDIIKLFLEDPDNTLIFVSSHEELRELEARTAPIHHGRFLSADGGSIEHAVMHSPRGTRMLSLDAFKHRVPNEPIQYHTLRKN